MTRVAPNLPGYASVGRAADILHLARRSVRELIYSGRLPSVRLGRLHFIKASDVELERRRRLRLPLQKPAATTRVRVATSPTHAPGGSTPKTPRVHVDPALRRQRAAERAQLVRNWAQRHHPSEPRVPATVLSVDAPVTCEVCGRDIRHGRVVELQDTASVTRLCTACGRRALLDWADRRRQESAAARRLADSLRQPEVSTTDTSAAA